MRKQTFGNAKKRRRSAKLISNFVFTSPILQFLQALNPTFPVSLHLVQLGLSNLFRNHIVGFLMPSLKCTNDGHMLNLVLMVFFGEYRYILLVFDQLC